MDVDTLFEIISERVLKVLRSHKILVQTFVPKSSTFVCIGDHGKRFLLMPARLYYPVDLVEVAKEMKLPTSVTVWSLLQKVKKTKLSS